MVVYRKTMVYYNTVFIFIATGFSFFDIFNRKIVLQKVITEMSERSNFAKNKKPKKSNAARNTSSQSIRLVGNKL